jgi:hypothetical protein
MISVRDCEDGTYAVIDGMHRVTCLQALADEKWLHIDYTAVPSRYMSNQSVLVLSCILTLTPYSVDTLSPCHYPIDLPRIPQIQAVVYEKDTPASVMLAIAQCKCMYTDYSFCNRYQLYKL